MRRFYGHLYRWCSAVRQRAEQHEGQALIEYALILGLVAVLTIAVLQSIGANVSGLLDKIGSSMSSVSNP